MARFPVKAAVPSSTAPAGTSPLSDVIGTRLPDAAGAASAGGANPNAARAAVAAAAGRILRMGLIRLLKLRIRAMGRSPSGRAGRRLSAVRPHRASPGPDGTELTSGNWLVYPVLTDMRFSPEDQPSHRAVWSFADLHRGAVAGREPGQLLQDARHRSASPARDVPGGGSAIRSR